MPEAIYQKDEILSILLWTALIPLISQCLKLAAISDFDTEQIMCAFYGTLCISSLIDTAIKYWKKEIHVDFSSWIWITATFPTLFALFYYDNLLYIIALSVIIVMSIYKVARGQLVIIKTNRKFVACFLIIILISIFMNVIPDFGIMILNLTIPLFVICVVSNIIYNSFIYFKNYKKNSNNTQ